MRREGEFGLLRCTRVENVRPMRTVAGLVAEEGERKGDGIVVGTPVEGSKYAVPLNREHGCARLRGGSEVVGPKAT